MTQSTSNYQNNDLLALLTQVQSKVSQTISNTKIVQNTLGKQTLLSTDISTCITENNDTMALLKAIVPLLSQSATDVGELAISLPELTASPVVPPPTSNSNSYPSVTGFAILPPDYTAHPSIPAVGVSFVDAGSGATITRLTNAASITDVNNRVLNSLKIMYSQFAPDNYNGEYFLAEGDNAYVYVMNKDGSLFKPLFSPAIGSGGITENNAPRWDYSGNAINTVYYTGNNRLYSQDVTTGVEVVVHDFSDIVAKYPLATSIFMDGHSDSDSQSRIFPIQILATPATGPFYPLAFVMYDRVKDNAMVIMDSTNVPSGTTDMANNPPMPMGDIHNSPFSVMRDGKNMYVQWNKPYAAWNPNLVGTTRDGAHVYPIIFDTNGNPTGINFGAGIRVAPDTAHMCSALDSSGKAWYVVQNNQTDNLEAVDPAVGIGPSSGDTTSTLSTKIVNIDTAQNFGWPTNGGGIHFSAPYRNSDYVGILFDADKPDDAKLANSNQTFVFRLKAGAIPLRLSPTYHSNPAEDASDGNYDDQHYGSFSQDGQRFYWASNWCKDASVRDIYVINLPNNWESNIP